MTPKQIAAIEAMWEMGLEDDEHWWSVSRWLHGAVLVTEGETSQDFRFLKQIACDHDDHRVPNFLKRQAG